MDAIQLIEARKAEIAKRVTKLRSQLDAAEAELRNLEITADTLARLNLHPSVDTSTPRGQSVRHVFGILGESEEDGKTPKEIYDALVASAITSITQDNVRTILSRQRDRLESNEGKYWRKPSVETKVIEFEELLGGNAQIEKEPLSDTAGGSVADHNPVRTGR